MNGPYLLRDTVLRRLDDEPSGGGIVGNRPECPRDHLVDAKMNQGSRRYPCDQVICMEREHERLDV